MLDEKKCHCTMNDAIGIKDRIKAHKVKQFKELGLSDSEIEARIDKDPEIKELVEWILDKAVINRVKKELKQTQRN